MLTGGPRSPAPGPAAARPRRPATSGFVVATSAFVGPVDRNDDAIFHLEAEPAPGGVGHQPARDLSLEASIIDIQDLTAPPAGRDPLRGLRRAVAARAGGADGGDAGVEALAAALAALLEGSGVSVAVRAPDAAAAGAAARAGRGPEAFVLRGRFIVIKRDDEGIIVDPSFREAFRIAPATPGYARLVEALPETYIGDACTLRRLVALVTAQAARSYEAQGLTQPPWRRFSAMMARWAPPRARYTDTVVTPPSSPLKRMGSEDAARLAFATADAAARGAVARLAGAGLGARVRVPAEAAAPPARVVRGFDLPAAPPAVAVA